MYLLLQYLERCSHFEKTVDTRLKEMRLMQASEDSVADHSAFVSKNGQKKGNNKEKHKNKVQVKEKGERFKKKARARRLEKDGMFFEELAESQATFFQTVKRVKKNLSSREEEKHFPRAQDFLSCCLERVFSRLLKH